MTFSFETDKNVGLEQILYVDFFVLGVKQISISIWATAHLPLP